MSRKNLSLDNSFSERLRVLIKEKLNISQVKFSNKIGISDGYLSMVLANKRGPSSEMIVGIFLNYREYMHWLITGEDENIESVNRSIDIDILRQIIEGVEEGLKRNKLKLEPDKKARLISLLYEHYSESDKEPDNKTVTKYLQLVS